MLYIYIYMYIYNNNNKLERRCSQDIRNVTKMENFATIVNV